jgi:predicted restriction endonuclease
MKNVEPEKRLAKIEQTLRKDKKIVELLKKSANYKCQFPNCESEILTKKGTKYVEVAHIKPVHKGGQSILGNLIVLCPNHHKEFDYGTLNIVEQTDNVLTGTLNGKTFTIDQKTKLRPTAYL